ncbi:MAG: hypothetical protein AAF797_12850 [Planctomycetota bacterium]
MTQTSTTPLEPARQPPPVSPGPTSGSGKLILVAAGLALLAVILVNVYVAAAKQDASEETFTAYTLEAPKEAGDRLDADDVRELRFPLALLEPLQDTGFIVKTDDSAGIDEYLNRPFLRDANRNDPLRDDHFTGRGSLTPRVNVTPGKRLVALPVNARSIPASLVPGAHIDIEARFSRRPGIFPVMENVRVIAVGRQRVQDLDADDRLPTNYSKIDIELDPKQATDMSNIESQIEGNFIVHVRPAGDPATPKIEGDGINPALKQVVGRLLSVP